MGVFHLLFDLEGFKVTFTFANTVALLGKSANSHHGPLVKEASGEGAFTARRVFRVVRGSAAREEAGSDRWLSY